MHTTIFTQLLALATAVSAIQITFPKEANSKVDLSVENTITWETVTGDPTTTRLELVNNVVFPATTQVIEEKLETKDGKYTLKPLPAKLMAGYQFNFVRTSGQGSGLLAQGQQFSVSKAAANTTVLKPTISKEGVPSNTAAGASPSPTQSGSAADKVKVWGGVGALAAVVAFML